MIVEIKKLIYGGYGLARKGDLPIFIPFSSTGDLLDVEITEEKKRYKIGAIKKNIRPSDDRVEPDCRYYGKCGGCHYQHISYNSELLWKSLIVEEQLRRLGSVTEINVQSTVPSPKLYQYRNRVQVHNKNSDIGFFAYNSDQVIDIESCPVSVSEINKELKRVRKNWPSKSDRIELSTEESGFFNQVNPSVNELIKTELLNLVKKLKPSFVMELYAGSGNFTYQLLDEVKQYVAVENDPLAVSKAKSMIVSKYDSQLDFILSDVKKYLKKSRDCFDLILVDPPRQGLGKEVIDLIVKNEPANIIYISCNPSTLARDVKYFRKKGWVLQKTQPFDMFPQTYHIETFNLLSKT